MNISSVFSGLGRVETWGAILDCINLTVTEEMNMSLMAPVSEEEIKAAALQMGGLKALVRTDFRVCSTSLFGGILWGMSMTWSEKW